MKAFIIPLFAMIVAGCGPQNRSDCYIQVSKDAQSDRAASIGYAGCNEKFPE